MSLLGLETDQTTRRTPVKSSFNSTKSRHERCRDSNPLLPAHCHLYGNPTLKKRGAKNSKGESGMKMETLQNAEAWAVETFGAAELGDVRRTDRLVKGASALGEKPSY